MEEPPTTEQLVYEIISLTKNISCADNRLELPIPEAAPEVVELTLIGKIISHKSFNTVMVRDIVMRAWNPSKVVSVSKMDTNIFLFNFEMNADLEEVFK